jgi:hypothetical protein
MLSSPRIAKRNRQSRMIIMPSGKNLPHGNGGPLAAAISGRDASLANRITVSQSCASDDRPVAPCLLPLRRRQENDCSLSWRTTLL